MTPITQSKVVIKNAKNEVVVNGNCYAAAIASMLDLPITEVPNVEVFFHVDPYGKYSNYWLEVMDTWLESKGYELRTANEFRVFHPEFESRWPENADELRESLKDKYYLVTGDSIRGFSHITIYQNGKLVHDPHPSRDGIIKITEFQTIVPAPPQQSSQDNQKQ